MESADSGSDRVRLARESAAHRRKRDRAIGRAPRKWSELEVLLLTTALA